MKKQKLVVEDFWLSSEGDEMNNLKEAQRLIEKSKSHMSLALPKHMSAERMAKIALVQVSQTPALQKCNPKTVVRCLMVCAQLGLEPGIMGHAYLIPFKEDCTLVIGYRGMIDLARRSGQIESIEARVVHENDFCELRYGLDSGIDHSVDIRKEGGAPIGYYAIAKIVGGGKQFEFMSKSEVDKVRSQSKAGKSGPWVTHYDEMAKKTCIRRLFKYLPISIEMTRAVSMDEFGDMGKQSEAIETEFFEVDEDEGGEAQEKNENQSDSLADKLISD